MPVYYPIVRISIYPIDGSGPYKIAKQNDPNDDVLSVSTNHNKGNPQGTFVVDFVQRPVRNGLPWHRLINPMDTVVIEMKRAGAQGDAGKMRTVMIGFIDRVSATEIVGEDGSVHFVSRIQGSDFGKLLRVPYLHFFKYFSLFDVLGVFSPNKDGNTPITRDIFNESSPAQFMRLYLEGLANRVWDFEMNTPKGFMPPHHVFDYSLESLSAVIGYDWTIYDREGDLWKLFQVISEQPFHELFMTYTEPGGGIFGEDQTNPQLRLRKTKFDGSGPDITTGTLEELEGKKQIFTSAVPDSDALAEQKAAEQGDSNKQQRGEGQFVFSRADEAPLAEDSVENQMSRGDTEIFTAFTTKSRLFHQNEAITDLVAPLAVNKKLYKTFGYREMTVAAKLLPDGLLDAQDFAEVLTRKLVDWFQFNHLFWSGQKTFALRPDVRLGAELVDETARRGKFSAFIEGYTHKWIVGGTCTTTIQFTRGVFEREVLDGGTWTILKIDDLPTDEQREAANMCMAQG